MRSGRGRSVVAIVVLAVAVLAGAGCRRSLEGGPDAAGTVIPADAAVSDGLFAPDLPTIEALSFERFMPDGIAQADPDAGTCLPPSGDAPAIVCFGSDPLPYETYLQPLDGGPAPGQCPSQRDFMRFGGERCGYLTCGPLLGSAVPADAGATAGDAGTACCFYVAHVCGV